MPPALSCYYQVLLGILTIYQFITYIQIFLESNVLTKLAHQRLVFGSSNVLHQPRVVLGVLWWLEGDCCQRELC